MRFYLLLIRCSLALHADIIIILLRQMGHNPIRLHTADFPTQSLIKMGFEANHWNGALCLPGVPSIRQLFALFGGVAQRRMFFHLAYVEMRWEIVENC
jgi:hypothetical protein